MTDSRGEFYADLAPSTAHSFSPGGMPNVAFNHKTRSFTPLNDLARDIRADNERFWTDLVTGEKLVNRNKGEMFMLMVTELAEAFEGERKGLMDDHLPHRKAAEVELADEIIRVLDYAGEFGFDMDGAVAEKRAYNATRKDHTREARLAPNGKKW
jgi:hypothetical protein